MDTATERPWVLVEGDTIQNEKGIDVCALFNDEGQRNDNATLIVRAVNAHDGLVEACELVYANLTPAYPSNHLCMVKLRNALSKAMGGK